MNLALHNDRGEVLLSTNVIGRRNERIQIVPSTQPDPGRYSIHLKPAEVTNQAIVDLVSKTLGFTVEHDTYSRQPYGTFEQRRIEALKHEAGRRTLYGEIAKMELGAWEQLDQSPFLKAIETINARRDTSDFLIVGLIGALARYGQDSRFPPELKTKLEAAVLDFRYWADEPGKDVMWFYSENHQITFHAAELLAGQLFADRRFTNNQQTGRQHHAHAKSLALAWLRKRGRQGFHEWDSNTYFSVDLLALAHLADLTTDPEVRTLAQNVLTKMLFTIAVNSFQGVFGSTHARTYPGDIKSGRGEGTSARPDCSGAWAISPMGRATSAWL